MDSSIRLDSIIEEPVDSDDDWLPPADIRTRVLSARPVAQLHQQLSKHPVVLRGRHKPGARIAFNLHSSPRSPLWYRTRPHTAPDRSRTFKLAASPPGHPSSPVRPSAPRPSARRPNTARPFQSAASSATAAAWNSSRSCIREPATTRPRSQATTRPRSQRILEFHEQLASGQQGAPEPVQKHRKELGSSGDCGWWPRLPAYEQPTTPSMAQCAQLYDPVVRGDAPEAVSVAPVQHTLAFDNFEVIAEQVVKAPRLAVCRHCGQVRIAGVGARWHNIGCPGGTFSGLRFGSHPCQSKYSTHAFHQQQANEREAAVSERTMRRDASHALQHRAARLIQGIWRRRFATQLVWLIRKIKTRSAITIQRVVRGKAARSMHRKARVAHALCRLRVCCRPIGTVLLLSLSIKNRAARRIQSVWRHNRWRELVRCACSGSRKGAIIIQKMFRGYTARYRHWRRKSSVLLALRVLQPSWRGTRVRLCCKRRSAAAREIQTTLRQVRVKLYKAACMLQRVWRGRSARVFVTVYAARRLRASTHLQQSWRRYKRRCTVSRILNFRTELQLLLARIWRGHRGRKRVQKMKNDAAATRMQSVWRGHHKKESFTEYKWKVTRVQAEVKKKLALLKYGAHRKRMIQLQAVVRCSMARAAFLRRKRSLQSEITLLCQGKPDLKRIASKKGLFSGSLFPEADLLRTLKLLVKYKPALRFGFLIHTLTDLNNIVGQGSFRMKREHLTGFLREIGFNLGGDIQSKVSISFDKVCQNDDDTITEEPNTPKNRPNTKSAGRPSTKQHSLSVEQFYEVILRVARRAYPSRRNAPVEVFGNFNRFLRDYGPTIQGLRRIHSLPELIGANPIPNDMLRHWLEPYSAKLDRLHKHYGHVIKGTKTAGLGPAEFVHLCKECDLTDSDFSMFFCLEVCVTAQTTSIDRFVCDGEFASSQPMSESKISELFAMKGDTFQTVLGAIATAKDRNNANNRLQDVLNTLVVRLLVQCPDASALHLF